MYNYIYNFQTNTYVSIYSQLGKKILNSYISTSNISNSNITNYNTPKNIPYQKGGLPKMTLNLIYMAKPVYGGWVSFTAHLSLKYNLNLYKIGNRTETNSRDYGYGVKYRNISIDEIKHLDNILITAIDKNYYKYLNSFPDNTKIVIHDPTEVKGKSCQPVLDNLNRFNVITIRETVKQFIKDKYNVKSLCLPHPFFPYPKSKLDKSGAVSISRIDYDKHTEIIIKANKLLKTPITIYGAKNDLFVYRVLKDLNLDSMSEKDPISNYKGRFAKSFPDIDTILAPAKWMVDMSAINNDGGGSQYTFLEAIYQDCCLILSDKWINVVKTHYKHNYNCLIVKNEMELSKIIVENKAVNNIVNNAKLLLKPHIEIDWIKELSI
uniref:Glycosyl transferase family 1 domain-containing protein n=1 Tax=viral metagenome TaxID=1070528 RepID=A0A6C0EJ06_9ZZZZ